MPKQTDISLWRVRSARHLIVWLIFVTTLSTCGPADVNRDRSGTMSPTMTPSSKFGARVETSTVCQDASPIYLSSQYGRVVRASSKDFEVVGLLFLARYRIIAGDSVKIVWRITGSGPLGISVVGPSGMQAEELFPLEPHGGSSFDVPGDEWGSGYAFGSPGCWRMTLARGGASTSVTIGVE